MTQTNNKVMSLTKQLLHKNDIALQQFEKYALTKTTADFSDIVKPFVNEVKEISDEWIFEATKYLEMEQPKYLHLQQLEDAHENILIQAVACFQVDTKKKRFKERNKSIDFILNGLLNILEQ